MNIHEDKSFVIKHLESPFFQLTYDELRMGANPDLDTKDGETIAEYDPNNCRWFPSEKLIEFAIRTQQTTHEKLSQDGYTDISIGPAN